MTDWTLAQEVLGYKGVGRSATVTENRGSATLADEVAARKANGGRTKRACPGRGVAQPSVRRPPWKILRSLPSGIGQPESNRGRVERGEE